MSENLIEASLASSRISIESNFNTLDSASSARKNLAVVSRPLTPVQQKIIQILQSENLKEVFFTNQAQDYLAHAIEVLVHQQSDEESNSYIQECMMRIDDLTGLVEKLKTELKRTNSQKLLAEQSLENTRLQMIEVMNNNHQQASGIFD